MHAKDYVKSMLFAEVHGFPQETEEDFQMLINFIKEVRWDRLGAFTFSNEEDTPAYTMDGQISQEIMDERLELPDRTIPMTEQLRGYL